MTDEPHGESAPEEPDLGGMLGVPRRAKFPAVSLLMAVVFLSAGATLLWLVRNELAYFFASARPAAQWIPTPTAPLPPNAPSNVYAEIRVDPANLCDYWDPAINPFPPDQSYAFTLKMGFGSSFFMTCVGTGDVRPRLWILKPETSAESDRIHEQAVQRRLQRSMLASSVEGPVPEIHVPGGDGCVNDLCRGRLVTFRDYAVNVFAGVGTLESTLADRLAGENRRTGLPPLRDDDYLLLLGETPKSNYWYAILAGVISLLSILNIVLAARFLLRWSRSRAEIRGYLEQARRAPRA